MTCPRCDKPYDGSHINCQPNVWLWDIGICLLIILVASLLIVWRMHEISSKYVYKPITPRGLPVITQGWKPIIINSTSTLPNAINQVPSKYLQQTCYNFMNQRVCQ